MKLTVVTPSYNQGDYLEETIISVISQKNVDLEYIVIDGGSKDKSVEIIKKYDKYISWWISEPDKGQTHALIKGFSKAKGNILCYLNSDDVYFEGVLGKVVKIFENNPNTQLLYGDNCILYPDGRVVGKPKISFDFKICLNSFMIIPQPSAFWTKKIYYKVGGLNPKFQYCFDYDLFLRIGQELYGNPHSIVHVKDLWSKFRVHGNSKTITSKEMFSKEMRIIRNQFNFINNRIARPIIKYYYLIKAIRKFYFERGFIPLSSGPGKF